MIANGRPRLSNNQGDIEDQQDLMKNVYEFYLNLMGLQGEDRVFSLAPNL
jgi:hypothetical protein